MRKHKKICITVLILLFITASTLLIIWNFIHKGGANFLSTDPKISAFVTGGEIDNATRTYDRFGSSGGYTPVKLDVSSCPKGRDATYFGLGHTEFLVEGLKESICIFKYGTEIENPNWDGKLNVTCKIPAATSISLSVGDQGIDFTPISKYCSGNN